MNERNLATNVKHSTHEKYPTNTPYVKLTHYLTMHVVSSPRARITTALLHTWGAWRALGDALRLTCYPAIDGICANLSDLHDMSTRLEGVFT